MVVHIKKVNLNMALINLLMSGKRHVFCFLHSSRTTWNNMGQLQFNIDAKVMKSI